MYGSLEFRLLWISLLFRASFPRYQKTINLSRQPGKFFYEMFVASPTVDLMNNEEMISQEISCRGKKEKNMQQRFFKKN